MEEIVVVMSPNQADDLDDYTTFEFESAPHLNETFMSQVGATYLVFTKYRLRIRQSFISSAQ